MPILYFFFKSVANETNSDYYEDSNIDYWSLNYV